jgi:YidC/Oxa1 family membrane protein insertase
MDRTGIIVISLCALLLGWWFIEQNKFQQAQARWQQTNQVAQLAATLANTNAATAAISKVASAASTATAPVVFAVNSPEQTLTLVNGHVRYTFTSRGGGLKSVELLDYTNMISVHWKGRVPNSPATLNQHAPVPALAVLGDQSLVGDGEFSLTPITGGVRAEKTLADGLVVTKEFQLSSNYLVKAQVTLKNGSDKPLLLPPQEIVAGTATPMDADDTGQLWGAMWSDGTNATDNPLPNFAGGGCSRSAPKTEIRSGNGAVAWVAAHNQFFALLAMPKEPAREMVARTVTLPRFVQAGDATNAPAPQGVQTAFVYPAQTLTANSSVTHEVFLYAGPKELRTLTAIGLERGNHAELAMNFGTGFSSFWGVGTFFAKLLLSAMNLLHDWIGVGYGWTIVLITALIRVLFWPLTAKSTRSMKKMSALQPEMNALKEKYKDDQQKLMQKQMELWKKHGVSPMSGCLPMLVQMPVFIGFFTMIRSAIELRGASFLWAADLSKPDTLLMIPGITFIPFLSAPDGSGLPLNLLPLLMVGAMLWQSHLTPASPGMDPAQQKMMRWMPAIFVAIFYNYSSGLALYMTVSTLLGILQTRMTKNITVNLDTPALTSAPKSKK